VLVEFDAGVRNVGGMESDGWLMEEEKEHSSGGNAKVCERQHQADGGRH